MQKPRIAVHKFSSCDGCQLAFLNAGEQLLKLSDLVEIVHFAEAGYLNEDEKVDITFIEGSVSTSQELKRILRIRDNSGYLVTIGACATSGGIQALRNINDAGAWVSEIYAQAEYIDSLDQVSPISEHVKVDFELWGCPVNINQVMAVVRSLLNGVAPRESHEKVCMECKRRQTVCTLVSKGTACLGAVTQAGCGALCPSYGRNCYACFGPAGDANNNALATRLSGLGYQPADIIRRFQLFHNNAPQFRNIAKRIGNDEKT